MVGDGGEIRGAANMTRRDHDPRAWFGAIGLLLTAIVLLVIWIFQCKYRAAKRRVLAGLDDDLLRDVGLVQVRVRAEARRSAGRA